MPFGIIGRTGPGMTEWGLGIGTFGANLGRAIVTNGLRHRCATVPQPSELRFGVVRVVDQGIAALGRLIMF